MISYRYGQRPVCKTRNPDRLSLTELEFRCALARKLPICMFIMHPDHPIPSVEAGKESGTKQKLKDFVQLAKKDRIYAEFKSVDDLRTKAVQSLVKLREVLDERSTIDVAQPQNPDASEASGAPAAVPVRGSALSNVPIAVPRCFMGREETLDAIDAALERGEGRVAVTALHGLRGVGKTTLAAAYAARHRAAYRATWWVQAQTESTIRASLASLGVRLGWVAPDEKEEPALEAVRQHLRDEGEGLLLIYDNAPDADSLKPYLPLGGAARVLVTSTAPNWRGVAATVKIEVWPKEVGADYLVARTGGDKEHGEAEALSEALDGLPLAHEQAAAYCDRLGVPLAEYRERFTAIPGRLLDTVKDAPAEYHNKLTVAKAFALAIDEAAKLHPAAEPLIAYAALLAPEPIPLFLFSEASEKFAEPLASQLADGGLDEAVASLRAFALVERETIADERDPSNTTDTIRLHRLVRIAAAARRGSEAAAAARGILIEAVAAVYPENVHNDPRAWVRARRLDALALDLVSAPLQGVEGSASYLLGKLGTYRRAALAAYAAARPLSERALAIREKALGPNHPDTAASLNGLAGLLEAQSDAGSTPPHR